MVVSMTKVCFHCNGSGEVPFYPDELDGQQDDTVACSVCKGTGFILVGDLDLASIAEAIESVSAKCDEIIECFDGIPGYRHGPH